MLKENLNKYKDVFLSEAKEHIAAMNKTLLALEQNQDNLGLVNQIFIHIHTLKGMADTMEYRNIVQLCHAMEDILDAIKKKKVKPGNFIDTLFKCLDTLDLTLKRLKEDNEEIDTTALVKKLKDLTTLIKSEKQGGKISADGFDPSVESAVTKVSSIEVKVERLDMLMNLVEQLLINKMRLDKSKEELQNPELTSALDALARLIGDIQYNIIQARMVPIGFVFSRFPRMVRDLAKQQGKQINLKMEGTEIELDRTVLDEIGEGLVHLLRNAVDHGIEKQQERKRAGKSPVGTIKLIATRIKDSAIIEISDDGAGIDFEEVKNSAVKNGILAKQSSGEDVLNSIFSGVSTTKHVTKISGRGFGLNIVKNKLDFLGGAIKVESKLKEGTRFTLEIPSTLAIIKALFVEAAGRSYAIPLANVERLVKVSEKDIKGMLNFEAIVFDNEDIPITRLDVLFRGMSSKPASMQIQKLKKQPIVIVGKGEDKLGIAVDAFLNTQEIVVKPLNKLLRKNKYFAGTTIIGSGDVALILDAGNLALTRRGQTQTETPNKTS